MIQSIDANILKINMSFALLPWINAILTHSKLTYCPLFCLFSTIFILFFLYRELSQLVHVLSTHVSQEEICSASPDSQSMLSPAVSQIIKCRCEIWLFV